MKEKNNNNIDNMKKTHTFETSVIHFLTLHLYAISKRYT